MDIQVVDIVELSGGIPYAIDPNYDAPNDMMPKIMEISKRILDNYPDYILIEYTAHFGELLVINHVLKQIFIFNDREEFYIMNINLPNLFFNLEAYKVGIEALDNKTLYDTYMKDYSLVIMTMSKLTKLKFDILKKVFDDRLTDYGFFN